MQQEHDIFDELRTLCQKPGFAHALSFLCYKNNIVRVKGSLSAEDISRTHSPDRLIRTELATLVGLMCQKEWDTNIPSPDVIQQHITNANTLLEELHGCLSQSMRQSLTKDELHGPPTQDSNNSGPMFREAISYATESAYSFQYRDFSPIRYEKDSEWLRSNKGFTIDFARDVILTVSKLYTKKLAETLQSFAERHPDTWTFLPCHEVDASEVAKKMGADLEMVGSVLRAFTLTGANESFKNLSDYNATNAFPILRDLSGKLFIFQSSTILESLYESPFFWMYNDETYRDVALINRGDYTERLSFDLLVKVFGASNTFRNIKVFSGKDEVGEIDVLVVYGNRAVVLQAKSKRLTIEAKKGNTDQLQSDFRKAIQRSYEQAFDCAEYLTSGTCRFVDSKGATLTFPEPPQEVFPLCVVADHYPSLAYQSRYFLKKRNSPVIRAPLIMDVFLIDAMTEMLESPLRFLSYLSQRSRVADKLVIGHELTALSFHLKSNLWFDDEFDVVALGDDISADLDAAMYVRRDGMRGDRTPKGILTKYSGTALFKIIERLEHDSEPTAIELGMLLLTINDETFERINRGLSIVSRMARMDRQAHDFSIGPSNEGVAITFHSSVLPRLEAQEKLIWHCHQKKHSWRLGHWLGICVDGDAGFRFGVSLNFPYEPDTEFDAALAKFPLQAAKKVVFVDRNTSRVSKIGRNDLCPCGSGRKHKRCCLLRN